MGAGSSGQALLTGGELAITRKSPAATLQAVSICRGSLSRRRERHGHKGGERHEQRNGASHINLLLHGGEYTRGTKVAPPVKALTGCGVVYRCDVVETDWRVRLATVI